MFKLRLKNRRIVFLFICVIFITFVFYGSFIEPFKITISHFSFDLTVSNNSSIKIVLISDLHVGSRGDMKFLSKVVEKINSYYPDLVLIAGDFINYYESEICFLEPLENLSAKYGVYAVLGNHEYGYGWRNKELADSVEKKLESLGVEVLRNENKLVEINKIQFYIVGLDSIWAGEDNLTHAMTGIKEDIPKILLCHNPGVVSLPGTEDFDLILSGHTHGGVVNLPLIGSVFVSTELRGKGAYGFHEIDGRKIYITRGIGSRIGYFFKFRFNSPPEIVIINLH